MLQVLGKGRPDDGWAGIQGRQVPLRDDQTYIPGLLNSQGTKVRPGGRGVLVCQARA